MTAKSGHNENHRIELEKVFESFPAGEREQAKQVWKESAHVFSNTPNFSHSEIENALARVHMRIGHGEHSAGLSDKSFSGTSAWRWILAAAVILLAFGLGLFSIPKTVTVPYGETAEILLPDGSSVELNSGSRISYSRLFTFMDRTVKLNGEAYFSVEKGELPFVVKANNSVVKVTGTEFNVRSWNEDPGSETEVTVTEGHVLFYPSRDSGHSVSITPGHMSRWSEGMIRPTQPILVQAEQAPGWRNNRLVFTNESLAVIFNELERRFDIRILLNSKEIAHETLTTYYAEPKLVESIIEDICRVKGLRYAKTANGYRVYR